MRAPSLDSPHPVSPTRGKPHLASKRSNPRACPAPSYDQKAQPSGAVPPGIHRARPSGGREVPHLTSKKPYPRGIPPGNLAARPRAPTTWQSSGPSPGGAPPGIKEAQPQRAAPPGNQVAQPSGDAPPLPTRMERP
nr:PREDICTED: proline-rich protein HaeIII subfamily 1-like [Bemisia tabaci]